jgi:hypothetical protein
MFTKPLLGWQNYTKILYATIENWNIIFRVHTQNITFCRKDYARYVMYVISLSNISIKTNFKQITRVEIRLTKEWVW